MKDTFMGMRGDTLTRDDAQRPQAFERDLDLSPMIDQVAYGFARVLVIAMKELETHIANENRKLVDTVAERLGALQASVNGLAEGVSEQRAESRILKEKCQQLESAADALKESDRQQEREVAGIRVELATSVDSLSKRVATDLGVLQEADANQITELANVRGLLDTETAALKEARASQASEIARLQSGVEAISSQLSERISGLVNEVAVHQEDLVAVKSTLKDIGSKLDVTLERVDQQSEALHSMYTTFVQRESELERVIEGLTRLRAVPAPPPAPRL